MSRKTRSQAKAQGPQKSRINRSARRQSRNKPIRVWLKSRLGTEMRELSAMGRNPSPEEMENNLKLALILSL